MNRVILQVPMSKELKEKAEAAARDEGFSSVQEIIRVLINKLAKREIKVSLYEEKGEYVKLSPAAKKRYAKAVKEIEQGIGVTKTNSIEELLDSLK